MPEFQRLQEVAGSPIYGIPVRNGTLLPVGRDALSQALYDTQPDWTVIGLTAAAYDVARESGDISLVGLAALAEESVVLAAVRESVVLYAEAVAVGLPEQLPEIVYVWKVDDQLVERAAAFIETFNALFRADLPAPIADNSETYWVAHDDDLERDHRDRQQAGRPLPVSVLGPMGPNGARVLGRMDPNGPRLNPSF